jgi:hypothetical protein
LILACATAEGSELGGEYRLRIESLDEPSFGLRDVESYTAIGQRLFVHADLAGASGPRLFTQLSVAQEHGREPRTRPFDRSRIDIAQLFADWRLASNAGVLLLRLGRQELDLDGNRLVSVREGTNLRRAFDLAFASYTHEHTVINTFVGRPVRNREGVFDDEGDRHERFAGASLTFSAAAVDETMSLGAFYFDRDREQASYADVSGHERRHTFGVRFASRGSRYDAALQAAYQFGEIDSQRIRAYAVAGDFGVRQWSWLLQPRLGVSFGSASGDVASDDRRLGTFDVVYPNLGYFTDAPLIYPGNTADVQPNVTAYLSAAATLRTGCDFIFRNEHGDAIYDQPGIELVQPDQTDGDRAATLCYVRARWQPAPWIELTASFVHASADTVLRAAGARSADYWLAQVGFRM